VQLQRPRGRSSKWISLISNTNRKKNQQERHFYLSYIPTLHSCRPEVKGWDCAVLSTSVVFLSLATYPHKIQRNKVKSYFSACQRWFCNLIPWSQDFAQWRYPREPRIVNKSRASFSFNSLFLLLNFWGQFWRLFGWRGHPPRWMGIEFYQLISQRAFRWKVGWFAREEHHTDF